MSNTEFQLKKLPQAIPGQLVLLILDGVGLFKGQSEGYEGNALDLANAPVLKDLLKNAPLSTSLQAHGTAVGMPSDDDMGNSEVGHNAMGAGRIFDQGAKLVQNAIQSGELYKGKTWKKLIGSKAEPGLALENPERTVHFIGLLSDGNVHSHINHLLALLDKCATEGVKKVKVHVLLDGRDVGKTSALEYVELLEAKLKELDPSGENYAIASGGGRMQLTMDRYDADWAMIQRGWDTHVKGEGRQFSSTKEAVETLRGEIPDVIDQDLPAFVITKDGKPLGPIQNDDVAILFNFRGDRAIELSRAFTEPNIDKIQRDPGLNVHYAGMMEYDGDLHIPEQYLVSPPAIDRTLCEYLVNNDVRQYAISETQKFGHVTYFWNGNNSEKFSEELETWKEIPSDNISFDEKPRMKADEITDALLAEMQAGEYRFLRSNYANGDMVGHTGDLKATIESLEAVDQNLQRILDVAEKTNATILITADHGNCDQMIELDKKGQMKKDPDGKYTAKTSHTLSPVPLILLGADAEKYEPNTSCEKPGIGNIAPTIMTLLGLEPPEGYLPSIVNIKAAVKV